MNRSIWLTAALIVLCGLVVAPSRAQFSGNPLDWMAKPETSPMAEAKRQENRDSMRCNKAFGWSGTIRFTHKGTRWSRANPEQHPYQANGDISIHGLKPMKGYGGVCDLPGIHRYQYWSGGESTGRGSSDGCSHSGVWWVSFELEPDGRSLRVAAMLPNNLKLSPACGDDNAGLWTQFRVPLQLGRRRYAGSSAGLPDDPSASHRVEWTLERELAPDGEPEQDQGPIQIRVEGPGCICGDTEGVFVASASGGKGGRFEAFELRTTKGGKPRVIRNQGGVRAELTLSGDAETTGGTELTAIHIGSDGKRTRSAAHAVSFCEVRKPFSISNPHRIASNDWKYLEADRTLSIQYRSEARLNGKDVSKDMEWEFSNDSEKLFRQDEERTQVANFEASQLPERNSSFGPHTITAMLSRDGCDCRSEPVTARVFFSRDGWNHPEGKGVPNWFYYWKQTRATTGPDGKRMPVWYVRNLPDQPQCQNMVYDDFSDPRPKQAACAYEFCSDITYCDDEVVKLQCWNRPDGSVSEGIDCFAESLRHENQHRVELKSWWGQYMRNYSNARDPDFDMVPSDVELNTAGCNPVAQKSCRDRPAQELTDIEFNAYKVGWSWPQNGPIVKEDWACPGKQCPTDKY